MTISTDQPTRSRRATFVVFEGIDGSGKTTLSNAVAVALRGRGLKVAHVREGGTFASTVTQGIREFGRDAKNLALTPHAELFIYLAREIQLFDEATAPALAEADVVIADRFFYTAELLATCGRDLPTADVVPVVAAAARGVEPDLVVLVDVDPHVARARRKVSKLGVIDARPPSRKGQAGVGLQYRMRAGYRDRAARSSDRWIVVDNTEAELQTVIDGLIAAVTAVRTGTVADARACLPPPIARQSAETIANAAERFGDWIDRRMPREPALAAWLSSGLAGPVWDDRRRALATVVPFVVATGIRNLQDDESWQLRRDLEPRAPGPIARSFLTATNPLSLIAVAPDRIVEASTRVHALVDVAPREIASGLWGRDDDLAWQLRSHLHGDDRVRSLAGVPGTRAWHLRDEWLRDRGGLTALTTFELAHQACGAVAGLDDEAAWAWRVAARTAAPVAALTSLVGLTTDRAWKWRRKHATVAAKTVLGSLALIDHPTAWDLRRSLIDRCPEALDSMRGLDSADAWDLRHQAAGRWPAAVGKSLGLLLASDRGRGLLADLLVRNPDNLGLWRLASQAVTRGFVDVDVDD